MDTGFDSLPAQQAQQPAPQAGGAATLRLPVDPALDSQALLQGGRAVSIRHNGEIYRLQATRQGKLILTK